MSEKPPLLKWWEYVTKEHPEIEWSQITGLRNRIVHEYFGISEDIVWHIVNEELTPLVQQLKPIMRAEKRKAVNEMKTLEDIKDILRDHKEELHMGSAGKEAPEHFFPMRGVLPPEYVPPIRGA